MGGETHSQNFAFFFLLTKSFKNGTIWGGFILFKNHKNIVL